MRRIDACNYWRIYQAPTRETNICPSCCTSLTRSLFPRA